MHKQVRGERKAQRSNQKTTVDLNFQFQEDASRSRGRGGGRGRGGRGGRGGMILERNELDIPNSIFVHRITIAFSLLIIVNLFLSKYFIKKLYFALI